MAVDAAEKFFPGDTEFDLSIKRSHRQLPGLLLLVAIGEDQRYFLKVLAVTATVSANSVAKGNTMKVGCRLNGKAR